MSSFIIEPLRTITAADDAALYLSNQLYDALKSSPVFMLLSGGSAISMYKLLFEQLATRGANLSQLTASLLDERFVARDSTDSNEQQLKDAGVLDLLGQGGARWISYLDQGTTGPEIAEKVSQSFIEVLASGAQTVIQAGLGDDAHTAGLLPTKDQTVTAGVFNSSKLVEYYELPSDAQNQYRQRITCTPAFIKQSQRVFVFATGEKKRAALERFAAGTEAINACPAIALYGSQSPVVVLTDQALAT